MDLYERRHRTIERLVEALKSNAFGGESKGFKLNCPEEVKNLSFFGGNSIEVPSSVKLRVYEKIMKRVLQTQSEQPNLSSKSPSVPSSERLIEVSRSQITMSSHMNEASEEGVSKECNSPASSRPGFKAPRRVRRRKRKTEDESSDSEFFAPKQVHVRGQLRRGRGSSNISRGMLDSGTFMHYFMQLWDGFSEDKVNSFAYLDAHWFYLYSKEINRPKVVGWIKKKGILSKKYILVPIVMWRHWSLLIFCHLGESLQSEANAPCALLLDSLQAVGSTRLEPLIRRLLLDLYKAEDWQGTKEEIKKIPLLIPKVPQQEKGDECGYYVLHFMYLFLQNAPEDFNVGGYPYTMKKDWFTVKDMESFYKRLDAFPSASSCHDDDASADSSDGGVELIEDDEFSSRISITKGRVVS